MVRTCCNSHIDRAEAIDILRSHETELKKLGVLRLFMFGSTARDEANEKSDVDLFFDYDRGDLGLFELMDVKAFVASVLGTSTDIVTRDSLHRAVRREIEDSALPVF